MSAEAEGIPYRPTEFCALQLADSENWYDTCRTKFTVFPTEWIAVPFQAPRPSEWSLPFPL